MFDPRAIALQGIGFSPLLVGVQGFGDAVSAVDWVAANARAGGRRVPYGREYTDAQEMRRSVELLRQIADEDEIVVALVMSAVPLLGETRWRQ